MGEGSDDEGGEAAGGESGLEFSEAAGEETLENSSSARDHCGNLGSSPIYSVKRCQCPLFM